MVQLRSFLLLITLPTFLFSCLGELENVDKLKLELSPKVGFPLVDSRVYFQDFDSQIADFQIGERADGTVTLSFEKELYSVVAQDYYTIPEQLSPTLTITGIGTGGVPYSGSQSVTESGTLQFATANGESLELLRLKGGTLRVHVFHDYTADLSAALSLPGITQNSQTLTLNENLAVGQQTFDYDLSGSILDLTNGGVTVNTLLFDYTVNINGNGSPLSTTSQLEVYFEILNPEYQLIYGTSDDRTFENQTGTESINILQNTNNTTFRIEEPSISIEVKNSFGVPFTASLNELSITGQEGGSNTLSGSFMTDENPFTIEAPTFENIGNTVTTTITADHTNSNLNDLVSQIPSSMSYDVSGTFTQSNQQIFVLDTSKAVITAKGLIPLYGYLNNFVFSDTLAFGGEIFAEIDEGELILKTGNRYPLNVGIVLEFLAADNTVLTSFLNEEPSITATAPLDATGKTTSVAEKTVRIALTPTELSQLQNATSVILKLNLSTSDGGNTLVRFTSEDFLDVNLGVEGRRTIID